jgi:rubrerythrin
MKPTSLDEIIDFAIEREKDAIKLYTELQHHVAFTAMKSYLQELVAMEKGHIVILQGMRQGTHEGTRLTEVPNLKLSDYFVAPKQEGSLDYQGVLELAMSREKVAMQLYSRMAEEVEAPELKALFEKIAAEEAGHKHHFESLYDEDILKEN